MDHALLMLTDEKPGDQEPGNDEEDVDSDESPADAGQVGVVEDHEEDCNGTEPLDVRSEPPHRRRLLGRLGCRAGSRNGFDQCARVYGSLAEPIKLRQHSGIPSFPPCGVSLPVQSNNG